MSRRSYNQYCGVARSLDIVGERWTLLIVRNLLLGPLRYSDLLRGLPGITTNLLAKRLSEMEETGLIERIRGSAPDAGHAWRLTSYGEGLETTVQALATWGWQGMAEQKRGEMFSFEFMLIALRNSYRGGTTLRVELLVDDVPYAILLTRESAAISRGSVAAPELRARGTALKMSRFLLAGRLDRKSSRGITIEGADSAIGLFLSAFSTEQLSFAK